MTRPDIVIIIAATNTIDRSGPGAAPGAQPPGGGQRRISAGAERILQVLCFTQGCAMGGLSSLCRHQPRYCHFSALGLANPTGLMRLFVRFARSASLRRRRKFKLLRFRS